MIAANKEEAEELVSLINNLLERIDGEESLDEWSCGYDNKLNIRDSDGEDLSTMIRYVNDNLHYKLSTVAKPLPQTIFCTKKL